MRRHANAFTIIELMVVISIMVLLMALLLPALSGARERARFARWRAYSHSLEQADNELLVYFNMEDQPEDLTNNAGLGVVRNKAHLDPFLHGERLGIEPQTYDGQMSYLDPPNKATKSPVFTRTKARWPGKIGLEFEDKTLFQHVIVPRLEGKESPDRRLKSFTVAFWLFPFENTSWNQKIGIEDAPSNLTSQHPEWGNFLFHSTSTDNAAMGINTDTPSNRIDFTNGENKPGQWYFWAYTINDNGNGNGAATGYYQGGTLAGGKQLSETHINPLQQFLGLYIGANFNDHSTDGVMDELGLWRRALDANQIAEMYRIGVSRIRD